jgi:hypothetical protein
MNHHETENGLLGEESPFFLRCVSERHGGTAGGPEWDPGHIDRLLTVCNLLVISSAYGIRTRVAGVRDQCPKPLDERAKVR